MARHNCIVLKLLCLACLAQGTILQGELTPLEKAVNQGNILFESGSSSKARSLYELEVDEKLEPWQNAILYYNIGTVLLSQKKYLEALSYFSKANKGARDVVLLEMRLKNNQVIASLMITRDAIEDYKENKSKSLRGYRKLLSMLEEVEYSENVAEEASCILDASKGAPECILTEAKRKTIAQIEILKKELMEAYFLFFLSHLSFDQALALSISFNEVMVETLNNIEVLKLFEEPQSAFKELLQGFVKHDKIDQFLKGLIQFYNGIIGFKPIPKVGMNAIVHLQNAGASLFKEDKNERINSSYELSTKALSKATDAFNLGNESAAYLYLEVSCYILMKTTQNAFNDKKADPKEILKFALEQEEVAFDLYSFLHNIKDKNALISEFAETLTEIQSDAIESSKGFVDAARKVQSESFNKDTNGTKIPWDEVIPLVIAGQEHAMKALNFFEKEKNISASTEEQKITLEQWKQALDLMKSRKSSSDENEQKEEGAPTSKDNKKTDENNQKLEGIKQMIQEMEVDDKSHLEIKFAPGKEGSDRPW